MVSENSSDQSMLNNTKHSIYDNDNVYRTRGHNFRLIKQNHTVNCYSNSFVGRTVNAWNALPASAFDFESVNSCKHILNDCDLRQFLSQ